MTSLRTKKSKAGEDEVVQMEARLKMLKEQMEAERKKREDLLKKNGTNSVWMNGRSGPMRGVSDVRALVRINARERAARPASVTSAADTETTSPTKQLEENEAYNNRPWTPGSGNPGWTPAARSAEGMASGPDDPPSRYACDGAMSSPEPPRPIEMAVMECQTEPMSSGLSRWGSKFSDKGSRPSSGSKRAVSNTYLGKILEARRQQLQK